MKRQNRRGGQNSQRGKGRGQGRGRGNVRPGNTDQYSEFPQRRPGMAGGRGRAGGGISSRGRGNRLLSSRIGLRGRVNCCCGTLH